MNNSFQEYITFANKLADEATITSMQYFRTSLDIDNKSDESPVTIADKNTELKIIAAHAFASGATGDRPGAWAPGLGQPSGRCGVQPVFSLHRAGDAAGRWLDPLFAVVSERRHQHLVRQILECH